MSLLEILWRQPKWLLLLESLILIALTGWADYVTGWEWSFFIFYSMPIVLVVLKAGRQWGFLFAFLAAAVWWLAMGASHPYRTEGGFALAAASCWFYFAVLVVAAAAVQTRRELDRTRIEWLERTQELEREILRTSEREQQRIGRDLHDGLGSHLAAIGYAATFLAEELRRRNQPETAKAEQIRVLVGEAVVRTRDLARGILPVQMEGAGLSIALEDLARTVSNQTGLPVSFYENGDVRPDDPEANLHFYRIAQEAVNNAVKHGGAKKITIILNRNENTLRLAVADDGKGLTPPAKGTPGMGFYTMRYRARALGGELKIDSQPGEGTIVSCETASPRVRRTHPAT